MLDGVIFDFLTKKNKPTAAGCVYRKHTCQASMRFRRFSISSSSSLCSFSLCSFLDSSVSCCCSALCRAASMSLRSPAAAGAGGEGRCLFLSWRSSPSLRSLLSRCRSLLRLRLLWRRFSLRPCRQDKGTVNVKLNSDREVVAFSHG